MASNGLSIFVEIFRVFGRKVLLSHYCSCSPAVIGKLIVDNQLENGNAALVGNLKDTANCCTLAFSSLSYMKCVALYTGPPAMSGHVETFFYLCWHLQSCHFHPAATKCFGQMNIVSDQLTVLFFVELCVC